MSAPLLLDLGNRRLKIRDPERGGASDSYAWGDAEAAARLRERIARVPRARTLLVASTAPAALEELRASVLAGRPLREVAAEDVPLEVRSAGTGIDRLLAAWRVHAGAGGACVVADCGTAFTVDAVDAAGRFLGGAIGPGLGVQRAALARACPHLAAPRAAPGGGIPADTAAAVAAGTHDALAAAVAGLGARYAAALDGPVTRVLTGGDARALAPLLDGWTLRHELVLEALDALARARTW